MLLILLPLVASMLLSIVVGVYILPRKEHGARAFALLAFAQFGISLFYLMELITPTLAGKVFWDDMQYGPAFLGSAMYLWFSITYASGPVRHPKALAAGLLVVPVIGMTLIALDPYIGVYRPDGAFLVPGTPFDVLLYDLSPAAWLLALYVNAQVIIAIIYMLWKLFILSPSYRLSASVIAFSMMLPLLGQVVGLLGVTAQRDITPYTFGLANLLIALTMVRGNLINLNPIAHSVAFENMLDANLIFDIGWRLVDYNRKAAEMLADRYTTLLGLSLSDLCGGFPEQIEAFRQQIDAGSYLPFVIADGEGGHSELFVSPIEMRGKTVGYSVLLHDVSDRIQLEQQRAEMLRHLDAYAHTVAHDIKNPLNTIMWAVHELTHAEENNLSPERRADVLAALEYTTAKAIDITESMLLLGSVQHDRAVEIKAVSLRECIEESVGRLDHDTQALNGQITIKDGDWPEVLGYASWVEQTCHNLIHNALKYGGSPPKVEICWKRADDGFIRCLIKDNGAGLTEEQKVAAFTPFKRFSERPVTGQGLGLAIVQRIVNRLGGRVGIDDADGGGSIFWIELPEAITHISEIEDGMAAK